MASLAERSASPWTATSMRDRPAGCSTCASSLCGALCGNGDGRRRPASMVCWWRSDGGEDSAPAKMVVTRRGATNTTLAATQRHPCRSGMVTAGCARSRLRPELVWRLAALKDQQKIPALTISLTHSRARGADDGGRRRRDASYGVARDSHGRKTRRSANPTALPKLLYKSPIPTNVYASAIGLCNDSIITQSSKPSNSDF